MEIAPWIKKGDKVQLSGNVAAQFSKPITGRVLGIFGNHVGVVWDHRPNDIVPGLVNPDELAPVDPLQKLSEI